MAELVKINDVGLSTYGWTLEEGNYPQLLRRPKVKQGYTYSWPNEDGEDYDPTATLARESQDFNLSFLIVAANTADLLTKYNNLIDVLMTPAGTTWEFTELGKTMKLHFMDATDWTDIDFYNGSARVVVQMRNRWN